MANPNRFECSHASLPLEITSWAATDSFGKVTSGLVLAGKSLTTADAKVLMRQLSKAINHLTSMEAISSAHYSYVDKSDVATPAPTPTK